MGAAPAFHRNRRSASKASFVVRVLQPVPSVAGGCIAAVISSGRCCDPVTWVVNEMMTGRDVMHGSRVPVTLHPFNPTKPPKHCRKLSTLNFVGSLSTNPPNEREMAMWAGARGERSKAAPLSLPPTSVVPYMSPESNGRCGGGINDHLRRTSGAGGTLF